MPKNAFLSLATVLTLFTLAVHLSHSVAELKAAANAIPAAAVTAPRQIVGPRPHQIRQGPTLILKIPEPKPILENILDTSGVRDHQRPLVASILGLLDPACLGKLQTFAVLYDSPKRRGLAGRGVILVSGEVPDQELTGLLLHEGLGHFRDITCVDGTPESGASAFRDGSDVIYNDDPSVAFYRLSWMNEKMRRSDAKREDFVTGYAFAGDNFEDLAESVTYYVTQEKTFRIRAASNPVLAQKLAWIETHMPKTKTIVESEGSWDGQIAWDATKLGFNFVSE